MERDDDLYSPMTTGRKRLTRTELFEFLEQKVEQYNVPAFVERDPVSIPHLFSKPQDIEIAGFFAAILAWGQRITILRKCRELLALMDNAPHEFVVEHRPADLRRFRGFCHRTFNTTDALYFIRFLKHFYTRHDSLASAFPVMPGDDTIEGALIRFRETFFSLPGFPRRTMKHISSPASKATCKRLAMYLRWMVRSDGRGVDFGLWSSIQPAQLVCPVDLHVDRVARRLGLIRRASPDWQTALELTANLRRFDPADPVKYDFALFGLGVDEDFGK